MLGEDAELSALAARTGAGIEDVRRVPAEIPVSATSTRSFRTAAS